MGKDVPKAAIILGSVLLLAVVLVLMLVSSEKDDKKEAKAVASEKAITAICQTTDYRKTCFDSLKGHNSTDPKELIQAAMKVNIGYIKAALKNATALRKNQTDHRSKSALDACTELGNRTIHDLKRSYSKFEQFDITNVDDILLDMKTWISGAMTHQETCLDGFDKLKGNAGDRMRGILTKSLQMTSNALAMVTEISIFLETMGIQGIQKSSHRRRRRRLLSHGSSWVDAEKHRVLQVKSEKIRPNIVVAKDGSGKYRTIKEAIKHIPKYNNRTFVLYIKQGVYEEHVVIETPFTNVMMIGDGPTKTKITGRRNFVDGVGTYQSATVAVHGDGFIARDIGFENSAGPEKRQAVALRASADKMIFFNCRIQGYQDTLYTHAYRQFYRDCLISGTTDFIIGDSAAIFQGCTLLFRKPLKDQPNIATAQGRIDMRQHTALVLQNCTFVAAPELQQIEQQVHSYLGRPWKAYSRTIIMESFLDDFIHHEGWIALDDKSHLKTIFYAEFNNRGPASPKAQRVKWPGVKELPSSRIKRFTAAEFLDGNRWISRRKVHYAAGFVFPVPKEDPNTKYSPVSTEETKDLGSSGEKTRNTSTTADSPTPAPAALPPSTFSRQATSPAPSPDKETDEVVLDPSPNGGRPPLMSPRVAPSPGLSPQSGVKSSRANAAATSPAISPRSASPSLSKNGSPRGARE